MNARVALRAAALMAAAATLPAAAAPVIEARSLTVTPVLTR